MSRMSRMSRSALHLFLALPLSLVALSCAELRTLDDRICGNDVIDASRGEVCDGHAVGGFDCVPAGEPWQCSFKCDDQRRCPSGFGCGTDDVCRRASGALAEESFADVSSQAFELMAGDFDADGRADIVGVEPGRLRVHFYDDAGIVEQTTLKSQTRPGIGKLSPLTAATADGEVDTTDDLSLVLNFGIGAMVSEGDRSFTAHTFGSITFGSVEITLPNGDVLDAVVTSAYPLALDALPESLEVDTGDETAALVTLSIVNGQSLEPIPDSILVTFTKSGTGGVLMVPSFNYDVDHAGPAIQGDFDPKIDPCQEIAFPKLGDASLTVYKTCRPGMFSGWEWGQANDPTFEPVVATIDVPGTIVGPGAAMDVDGNGALDIALTVADAFGVIQLGVAFGHGNGKFGSLPPILAPLPDGQVGLLAVIPDGQVPIFLGDTDADGSIDAITPTAVFRGHLNGLQYELTPFYKSQRAWTEAVVADFNGDGFSDVAACQFGAPDVDILTGNASSFYNPIQISTDGAVGKLAPGDFDGDVLTDLAFQDVLTADQEELLMIAFGRPSGGPEEPVEVATFRKIEHIVQGNVHIFGVDNITDLGVVGQDVDGELALSFLPGAGNRILQTPFLLSESVQNRVQLPLQTAVGVLRPRADTADDPLHNDVAALSADPEIFANTMGGPDQAVLGQLTLWGLFGTREADFEEENNVSCTLPEQSILFTGDTDFNAIVVSQAPAGETGRVFVATLVLHDLGDTVEFGSTLSEAIMMPGAGCELPISWFAGAGRSLSRVRAVDLDGNGQPEILARLGDDNLGTLELAVFWDGDLSEGVEPYILPDQPGAIVDYATGDLDGDGALDLYLLTSGGPARYVLGDEPRTLALGEEIRADLFGATAVLIADVDGDGVNDVAARSGSQLQVFRGIPRPEVDNSAP